MAESGRRTRGRRVKLTGEARVEKRRVLGMTGGERKGLVVRLRRV